MYKAIIIVVLSAIIAFFGTHRKMGFWGYFFASILMTPIIGLLLLFASDSKPPKKT
jgi:hypothetical protein